MNKEQFIALGLTEEQATKVAAASVEELKGFIPKARFDELNETKKKAEKDLAERDKQIEDLGKTAGTSEELKKQIEQLQAANKEAAERHAAELKELTLTNAIKSALTGKVHDEAEALVAGLFDRDKLVIDGDKVVGLGEQMKTLKESKPFLFKAEEPPQQKPGFKVGSDGKETSPNNKPASLADAVMTHINTHMK